MVFFRYGLGGGFRGMGGLLFLILLFCFGFFVWIFLLE
jgi:hypothetical protein